MLRKSVSLVVAGVGIVATIMVSPQFCGTDASRASATSPIDVSRGRASGNQPPTEEQSRLDLDERASSRSATTRDVEHIDDAEITAKADPPLSTEVEELANGYRSVGTKQNGKKEGTWITYNSEDEIWLESTFRSGVLEGKSIMWGPHGQPQSETEYMGGVANGAVRTWHSNGVLALNAANENGKHQGQAREWYSSGRPRSEVYYDSGDLQGRAVFFAEDGTIHKPLSGYYDAGRKIAELD